MKKALLITLPALLAAALSGCDKVDFPIQSTSGPTGPTGPVQERRVLLEDYTGTSCGTCPPAGITATQLEAQYGTKVVALTVHAGFLAIPTSPPLDYDFRNQTATDYYNAFGVVQNPTGMVNRINYPTSQHLLTYPTWGSNIATQVALPQDANIEITNNFNTTTRQLDVSVKTTFLNPLNGLYRLVVLLKEDSVIKAQKNDDPSFAPTFIENPYYHRHVLRAAINSSWGDTLVTTSVNAGDSITKNYVFNVPATYGNWNVVDTHCYVVAYIYDAGTSNNKQYEIVQAEEKKIK